MLYQTNPEKDRAKLQLAGPSGQPLLETYIYEPGFLRFNWHSSYELLTVLHGSAQIYQNGRSYRIREDDLILINPQEGHATLATEPDTSVLLLHIFPEAFHALSQENPLRFFCRSDDSTRFQPVFSQLRACMGMIYGQLSAPGAARKLTAHGALEVITGLLITHFLCSEKASEAVSGKQNLKKLREILNYTDRHFTEAVSLSALAAHLNMNASYLSAFIHTHLGITFNELLARKRLQHAVHLLNSTDQSVASISVASGFADTRSLNATFRKYFDITPGLYRKSPGSSDNIRWKAQFPRYLGSDSPSVIRKLEAYLPPFL